jgi:hypothetical protein
MTSLGLQCVLGLVKHALRMTIEASFGFIGRQILCYPCLIETAESS